MSSHAIILYLAEHRLLYWGIFAAIVVGLFVSVARAERGRPETTIRLRRENAIFVLLLAALTLLGRLPTLTWPEQNPDESQALATAITLVHDPRYWIAVDSGTHGPVVALPLLAARLLGGRLDYALAHLVAAVLLAGTLIATYTLCSRRVGELSARLAVLPVAVGVALTVMGDYSSYNGEHALIFLLAIGLDVADRAFRKASDRTHRWLFASGLTLGMMPWTKLQGLPSLAVAACLIAWRARASRRDVAHFAVGLAVPTVLFLGYVVAIGALGDFYRGYVDFALRYSDRISTSAEPIFWREIPFAMSELATGELLSSAWLAVVFLALGAFSAVLRKSLIRGDLVAALLLFASSAYEIYRPGNPYHHYFLLLVAPMILVLAALLRGWNSSPYGAHHPLMIASYMAFAVVLPMRDRLVAGTPIAQPAVGSVLDEAATEVLRYAHPDDRLVVWGWMARYHVLTQLRQGTRFAVMSPLIPPYDSRFEKFFASDFDAAPVPIVLDVVAPGSFVLKDRARFGPETFPPLASRLARGYRLVWEHAGMRLYVSLDRLGRQAPPVPG